MKVLVTRAPHPGAQLRLALALRIGSRWIHCAGPAKVPQLQVGRLTTPGASGESCDPVSIDIGLTDVTYLP